MVDSLFANRKIILAPMAGVGDVIFRELCRELGAQLTYTEMVSAKALSYNNEKTAHLLDLSPLEDKVTIQIFGHEPKTMATQAAGIEQSIENRLFAIDINMGCPARKIAGKGDGSALMKDPHLAADIVRKVTHAVSCPVTVKFRRGYEIGNETAVEFAHYMEDAGADAVAVHGRYAQQFYRGSADWNVIKQCKAQLSIPVIGNGDVVDGKSAVALLSETGCDAVMVGRGAQGNPWIFKDIANALAGDFSYAGPTIKEKMQLATRHAAMFAERIGNEIPQMRKHAMWYVAGTKEASATRRKINKAITFEDFAQIFEEARILSESDN